MARLVLCIGILIYACPTLSAQDKYDYTWLLGYPPNLPNLFAGGNKINFNAGSPEVNYFETPLDLWVPCVMSDENGNLQFYTNGCEIRNWQHDLMENGEDINSGSVHSLYCEENDIGYPAIHSLLALPSPGHPKQYYLFHMRQYDDDFTFDLLFSRIDMSTNNGLGKIIQKNVGVFQDTLMFSVSAVKHGNGRDWWIIVGEQFNDNTYCFLLDTSGVNLMPKMRQDSWVGEYPNVLCFSPDGKKLARSGHGVPAAFRIYDFDRCTGEISKPVTLAIPDTAAYVSWACFSPDSRYLYLTNLVSKLYQYDTWASDVSASVQLIGEYDGFIADYNLPTSLFTMTLGPDQRIYMSSNNGVRYLHTIHRPDEPGLACDFRQHDFQMPALSLFFLPNMPHYRLYNDPGSPCDTLAVQPPMVAQWRSERDSAAGPLAMAFTDISYFQPGSWHWTFGDGDTSLLPSPLHVFPAPGDYEVCLTVCNEAGLCDTLCRTVSITTVSTSLPAPEGVLPTSVWPNPVQDWLWVSHEWTYPTEWVLYDISGRTLVRRNLPARSGVDGILLQNTPAGLYFWQIRGESRLLASGKVVVQP